MLRDFHFVCLSVSGWVRGKELFKKYLLLTNLLTYTSNKPVTRKSLDFLFIAYLLKCVEILEETNQTMHSNTAPPTPEQRFYIDLSEKEETTCWQST